MKKFEEEFDKNVTSVALRQDDESVITVCDYNEAKSFGHGWVSPEDHQAEIDQLKSQLEKQQPEIPEFVATEIERVKSEGIKTLCDFYNCDVDWMTFGMEDLRGDELAVAKWFYHNTETFELAYSYGYTVAKEKRFYLKNKLTGYYLRNVIETESYFEASGTEVILGGYKTKFTQQEIDSMETGSYEQIPVEDEA